MKNIKYIVTEEQLNLILETSLPYKTFSNSDADVYKLILRGIGAPINTENLAFLYAWRQAENSLGTDSNKFCNNPFNTVWDLDPKGIKPGMPKSKMFKTTNPHGVKSYKTIKFGISATVNTILRNYPEVAQVLKTNTGKKLLTPLGITKKTGNVLNKWNNDYPENLINITSGYLKGKTPAPSLIKRNGCV
jgi:hypothetical protein